MARTAAIRFRLSVASQSSSVMDRKPPVRAGAPPTLLTRMSTRPPARRDELGGPAGRGQVDLDGGHRVFRRELVKFRRRVQGAGGHPRAARGKGACHGEADAAACAGDDGAAPGEIDVHHVTRRYASAGAAGLRHVTEPFILPFGRGADLAGVRPGRGDDRRAGHREDRTLLLATLTAWQALVDYAALEPGMRVLVQGGAGGVGGYAVQLAAILGGIVTATGSARQRRLGPATRRGHVRGLRGQRGGRLRGGRPVLSYDVVIGRTPASSLRACTPSLGQPPGPAAAVNVRARISLALVVLIPISTIQYESCRRRSRLAHYRRGACSPTDLPALRSS